MSFARAPKAFVEESKKFYLSHRGPVPSPIESAVTHDASTLPALRDFIVDSFNRVHSTPTAMGLGLRYADPQRGGDCTRNFPILHGSGWPKSITPAPHRQVHLQGSPVLVSCIDYPLVGLVAVAAGKAAQGTFQMSHAELQAGLGRDDLTADLWQLGMHFQK